MRNLKKFAAVTLAATMTLGSTITALAATSGDATYTGSGSFEGGETEYPVISVTLPTIAPNAYDYIADPNGLIAKTGSASATEDATTSGNASGDIKYGKTIFDTSNDTGVFFRQGTTDAAGTAASGDVQKYGSQSESWTVTNENARDLEVQVKLEASGDAVVKCASSDDFSGDTAKKIYIAVKGEDASGDVAVLGATAATIAKTVSGKPDNFTEMWDGAQQKYVYNVNPGATGWNDWSCHIEGALNKNAEWKENDTTFPAIKVTWSIAEKTLEKSAVAGVAASGKQWLSVDGTNGFGGASNVDSVTANGQPVGFSGTNWISISPQPAGTVIKITLKNGDVYKAIAP